MKLKFHSILQSKFTKYFLIAIIIVALSLIIFNIGMFVGFNKASFAYKWVENYNKNFVGPKGGFLKKFSGKDFIDSYGAAGQVLKVSDSEIIIKGKDNVEKIIHTDNKTIIKRFSEIIKPSQLNFGDNVIIIGEPDKDGKINAKFIRVMPALPPSMNNSYYFPHFKGMF